ncbi:M57 family metalloprotease [Aquimarina sp. RZ0]|uniref:M57 family metalloprotease n=1 Tax=Aquimarina sp. RZ0 TaxID=2607730 RepID=UPI0011F368F7|nr:M57 family metalloprotease [Aquimarina sp. RZ0]KAA1243575.1 peptidase [Aquimarina sp. RZ0]
MKKFKFLAFCAIVAGVVTSCEKNEISSDVQPEAIELSKVQNDALLRAGVNPGGAYISSVTDLDGTTRKVAVSGDIMLDVSMLEEGLFDLGIAEDGQTRQYRTSNLVTGSNRTIDILGFTGGVNALSSNMRTGLQWAVNNYNRLNNSLTFRLTFGTNFEAADMVVFDANQGGSGGSAGFPSAGRPNKFVRILSGLANSSNNLNEHVIGHEIGHSVGFRHTDYARRRCGGGNEGSSGVGAIRIPGTPAENRWGAPGLDSDSFMISCFDGSEDGEFSDFDIVALNFLY